MSSSTSTSPPPSQDVTLATVPEDIHYLIASELMASASPSAVLALAQSSRALRGTALQFAYRDLVLTQGAEGSKTRRAYDALLRMFRSSAEADAEGEVARHVRSVTVRGKVPAQDLEVVVGRIADVGVLRKLNWETTAHMPASILDKLHSTWPDLELSVRNVDRSQEPDSEERQMDVNLLSSPLLKSLAYAVYNKGHQADEPSLSEWPKLTKALVDGGSVRSLCLQGRYDGGVYGSKQVFDANHQSAPKALPRLDLKPGTKLPALEELTINVESGWGATGYLWDVQHCRMLRDAMDWTRLRSLNFGSNNPEAFFEVFTGHLPSLKALRFGPHWRDVGAANKFLGSLTALESLDIDSASKEINVLWPTIMMHKDTLKKLVLRPAFGSWYSFEPLEFNLLQTVAREFPVLEHLGWDIPCTKTLDAKYITLLKSIPTLTHLSLFIHVPGTASNFSALLTQNAMGTISPPPLSVEGARDAAIKIIDGMSEAHDVPLQTLTMYFSRVGYEDRAQPYLMNANMQMRRRKDRKGKDKERFEIRGKQRWGGPAALEEELSFEDE